MDRNFERALPLVLVHEGGWADHPKDPGGATMKGVTLATFRRYVKPNATKADLRAITDGQLAQVYRKHYWDEVAGDALPSGLDYAMFDYAVNSGPSRAAKHLQGILGIEADGQIGPITLAAIAKRQPSELINKLCDRRMAFLRALDTWGTFGKGWTRRVKDVRAHALAMVTLHEPAPTPSKPVERQEPVPAPIQPQPAPARPVGFWARLWAWMTGG